PAQFEPIQTRTRRPSLVWLLPHATGNRPRLRLGPPSTQEENAQHSRDNQRQKSHIGSNFALTGDRHRCAALPPSGPPTLLEIYAPAPVRPSESAARPRQGPDQD